MRHYVSGEENSWKDPGIHRNWGHLSMLPQPSPPRDSAVSPKPEQTLPELDQIGALDQGSSNI